MDLKIKIVSVFLMVLMLLTACQQSSSNQYLMTHPDALKKELASCQDNNLDTPYCHQVKQLASEFISLANTQRDNPLVFGIQIQQAEQELDEAKKALDEAKAVGDQSSPEAKQKITETTLAYQKQLERVQLMLSVVRALNTPGL